MIEKVPATVKITTATGSVWATLEPKQYEILLRDIRQIVRDELERHERGPTGAGGVWNIR